jgi:Photosynthetic reaction centre cytochrome C subunit
MSMRRLLGPLVIVLTLAVAGFSQPLIERARAAVLPTGNAAQPYTSSALGIDSAAVTPEQAKGVGPVDQSAPLDFSKQPKSVPHTYVPGQLYNVQVWKQYSYGQLVGQMANFTTQLGVQCSYCHNVANFAYDTPTKKVARAMIIMEQNVNTQFIDGVKKQYPNYAVAGAVGCETCHHGQAKIDVKYNVVPVQYLDYRYKTTKQAGYALNSMYSAAKSLGVNCLFCHNTADFISLQYYPTNQIAHKMWQMVDTINHQYLPASVKAVTCYTCHQGAKWPSALVTGGNDMTPVEAVAAHPEVHTNPGGHLDAGVH